MLELADLPYVGPGVLGSAVGMDKVIPKELLIQAKIPTTPSILVYCLKSMNCNIKK